MFLGWLLFLLGREAFRVRGVSRAGPLVLAALGATLTSGMFEYTLGDSEILMLILLLSALPFSVGSDLIGRGPAQNVDEKAPHAGRPDSALVLEQ